MSSSRAGATPQKAAPAPKIMSSRLANMKFMQRATAAPLPASPGTPASENEQSANRVKANEVTPLSSRSESLKPLGVTGAETMWTLDRAGPDPMQSTNTADEEDNDLAPWADDGRFTRGRLQYGGYKKAAEKPAKSPADDEDGEIPDDSNSNGDPSNSDQDAEELARQNVARVREKLAQRAKVDRDKSRKVVGERKKKEVRLNSKSGKRGISSGGQR